MIRDLCLRNRQKTVSFPTPELRRILLKLIKDVIKVSEYEVAVHLVEDDEMTSLNEGYLGHEGTTDVITFDHLEMTFDDPKGILYGEIFVCTDEAVRQSRKFK